MDLDLPDAAPVYAMESWASMLVTQPPVRKLNLHVDYMENGFGGGMKVEATEGPTLGDMAKAVAEFYRASEGQLPDIYRFDVEMSIYQPLDVERSQDGSVVYFAEGMRRIARRDEEVGFQRAWRTKLRFNLG